MANTHAEKGTRMPRRDGVYRSEVVQAPKSQALFASAHRYSGAAAARRVDKAGRQQESVTWQRLLWEMYDTVPEYRFAVDWVGNLLSKAILQVREGGNETANPHALDALASLFGGPDGQPEMLRLLGVNFTVAGEAWIIGEEKSKDEDDWSVVAATEIHRNGTSIRVEDEEVSEQALCIRLWKPHPQRRSYPNSPSRAVIPILNELVQLTEHVDATAKSRLISNGILLLPSEMEMPTIPVTSGNPGEEQQTQQMLDGPDAVTKRLMDIASLAISDRSSAAALVPLVLTAPGEYLEKIQHVTFFTEFNEHVKGLREEAIRRIATGMDMPPEVVLGTADVNHWGAWQIEEAAIKAHTEPLLAVILSALTTGYLRPYLAEQGVENYEDFTLEADTKEMRLRPNRSKEAVELYDRGELAGRAMRRENGFGEEDAPTNEELQFWLTKEIAKGQTMPEQVVAALEKLGVQLPWTPEGRADDESVIHEARPTRSLREHPRRAEPDPEESEAEGAKAERGLAAAAQPNALVMAADQMVYRALERAGNRLKGKVGAKVGIPAAEIYLSVETRNAAEAEELLTDAWSCLDRFSYPGVDNDVLREALHGYTLTLLRLQRVHTPQALARHLLMTMTEAA